MDASHPEYGIDDTARVKQRSGYIPLAWGQCEDETTWFNSDRSRTPNVLMPIGASPASPASRLDAGVQSTRVLRKARRGALKTDVPLHTGATSRSRLCARTTGLLAYIQLQGGLSQVGIPTRGRCPGFADNPRFARPWFTMHRVNNERTGDLRRLVRLSVAAWQ